MGHVLLVRHATTGRSGALKVLRTDAGRDEKLLARFRREVEVLGTLEHPAVVGLLDAGERSGEPWLVMEYASGDNLEVVLGRGQGLSPTRALLEVAALADGLRHAHERGIHHRDIKAENVVMGAEGRCTLVDFGVALQQGASRLTHAGHVMGTFRYLAPEVLEGGERDPAATDVYALGQLLCELLQGRLLFQEDPSKNAKQRYIDLMDAKGAPLDPGPAFPDKLRELVRRATAPDPEARIPSMAVFGEGLRELLPLPDRELLHHRLSGEPVPAPRRSRTPLILAALLLLTAGVACGASSAAALLVAGLWWATG